jgi:hypothetical protein
MIKKIPFPRWIAMAVLVVLLLSGASAGLFWPQVVAALTLPQETHKGTVPPAAMHSPAATAVPSLVATAVPWTTLAGDTFHREEQRFWGKATDGQLWGGDANSIPVFSLRSSTGQITNGPGAYDALLGPRASNAEIVFSGSISRFDQSSFGAVLHWNDAENWYKASLDGTDLILSKKVAGVSTRLAISPFAASAGTSYTLRFRVEGTALFAKVWTTGTPEPPSWLMMTHDSSLQSGFGGLRFVIRRGVTVNISAFSESGADDTEEAGKT